MQNDLPQIPKLRLHLLARGNPRYGEAAQRFSERLDRRRTCDIRPDWDLVQKIFLRFAAPFVLWQNVRHEIVRW
jgi:hypothetical protein